MKKFVKMFSNWDNMSIRLSNQIEDHATKAEFAKGDLIQAIGHPIDELIFIERGLVMASIYTDGHKQAKWFKQEDEFVVLVSQALNDRIVRITEVEALEDTVIWSWPGSTVDVWRLCHDEFMDCYRDMLARDLTRLNDQRFGLSSTAAEYYDLLRRQNANLVSRIPDKDLACFMGVSIEELSEAMKK